MIVTTIPIALKKKCVLMHEQGRTNSAIYDYFTQEFPNSGCTEHSFRSMLSRWARTVYPDSSTLDSGTFRDFTAHDATVQIKQNGEIIQAWIKQRKESIDPQAFIEAITGNFEKYTFENKRNENSSGMLEIPLFDMHWGISYRADYEQTLRDLVLLIRSKYWDRIEIPFGQDYFHNDSIINGQTTKGTAVQKVDTVKAVQDGKNFMFNLIEECLEHSKHVHVTYSPGNHDYSLSWMFAEVLLERYGPNVVDDSIQNRKIITYGDNAIMVTHGASKRAKNPKDLALVFISKFSELSNFKNKEVHAGHLHAETATDVYGVMVRRLSTRASEDDWSDMEDFVGSNKRFMLFEWTLNELKSIHYI